MVDKGKIEADVKRLAQDIRLCEADLNKRQALLKQVFDQMWDMCRTYQIVHQPEVQQIFASVSGETDDQIRVVKRELQRMYDTYDQKRRQLNDLD